MLCSPTTEGGRKHKKLKLHASLTASDSSTIAEEIVVLLRRLHPLPSWNTLINQYISASLQSIPRIILPAAEDPMYSHRRRKREGSHNKEEQVCSPDSYLGLGSIMSQYHDILTHGFWNQTYQLPKIINWFPWQLNIEIILPEAIL